MSLLDRLRRKKKINVALGIYPTSLYAMRDVLQPGADAFAEHYPWLKLDINIHYQTDHLWLLGLNIDTGQQLTSILMTRVDIENRNYGKVRPLFEWMVRELEPVDPANITSLQDSLVQEYDDILEGQSIMDELNERP